jgi:hypothetical protein
MVVALLCDVQLHFGVCLLQMLGLGSLNINASDDQIKRAYRKLILRYHPDKATERAGTSLSKQIIKYTNRALPSQVPPVVAGPNRLPAARRLPDGKRRLALARAVPRTTSARTPCFWLFKYAI